MHLFWLLFVACVACAVAAPGSRGNGASGATRDRDPSNPNWSRSLGAVASGTGPGGQASSFVQKKDGQRVAVASASSFGGSAIAQSHT